MNFEGCFEFRTCRHFLVRFPASKMGNSSILCRFSTNLRSLAYLYLVLFCYSSCIHCRSHGGRLRGLFARVFLGLGDSNSNVGQENVNIDQLIKLNRILFEELLSLERPDRQDGLAAVVKHRILHRADTGPFRMEVDPNNARLLNDTAKKILAKMMTLLAETPTSPPLLAEQNASRVEKACSKNCQNGGACLVGNGTDACFCLTGYRGEFCEFLDDCNRATGCGSSASCVDDGGHRRCRCQHGFYLSDKGCVAAGQCREVTCQNEGACLPLQFSAKPDGPKEFSCRCKLGFRGEFCEEVIPECDQNPCKQDEVCIATTTGSYCKAQKAVIRHRHRSLKLTWMSLLWLMIPLTSLLLASFIISKITRCKRIRNWKANHTGKTDATVRNSQLNHGKLWSQNRHGKNDKFDGQALLQEYQSEDDEKIEDGLGQIV